MATKRESLITLLEKEFPDIKGIKEGELWGGERYGKSIHLGDVAEGGTIEGIKACDLYAYEFDPREEHYIMGVHRKLHEFLLKHGWYVEPYDAGTWFAFPI